MQQQLALVAFAHTTRLCATILVVTVNDLVKLVFGRGLGLLRGVDEDADHERNALSMRCADTVLGV